MANNLRSTFSAGASALGRWDSEAKASRIGNGEKIRAEAIRRTAERKAREAAAAAEIEAARAARRSI
jgi:hypothetical protein